MTTTEVPISAAGNPVGFGRMLRKEDARFLRGQGRYVDDVRLPGMLHGAILRAPMAHARMLGIDTSAAEAHPKVKAVITGAVLETLNLAWMPTLSQDTQSVLVTDKARFQGQEVAFVIAEDAYSARDALDLIDVDWEPLPPVIDAQKALDADAAVIRDDLEGRTDNKIYDWEAGDATACDEAFAAADIVVTQEMLYPRVHPAPMETCGSVAHMDPVTGKLVIWTTTQAPHAHRTLYAMVAGLPEHKIQVISPDIGGGFGNKVDGGPRREPHVHLVRPRLPHEGLDRGEQRREDQGPARRRARRPRRLQRRRPADEVPRRLLPHLHRLL
jgi:carbon-monoxide dehydrogenase large subunit